MKATRSHRVYPPKKRERNSLDVSLDDQRAVTFPLLVVGERFRTPAKRSKTAEAINLIHSLRCAIITF